MRRAHTRAPNHCQLHSDSQVPLPQLTWTIALVLIMTQSLVIAGKINLLRDDAWTHEGGRVERGPSSDEKRSEIEQESAPINGLSY